MYKQHLIIFCKDAKEALDAGASLPMHRDVPRFYILNSDKPKNDEISWLRNIDNYFALGKAAEIGNFTEIAIRAGILYSVGWWHLMFCSANKLPSIDEINALRKSLDSNKGFLQLENIWGVSKEHILLFGLDKVLGSGLQSSNEASSTLDLVNAMRGQAANEASVRHAFLELVPTNGMVTQGSMGSLNEKGQKFIEDMLKEYPSTEDKAGVIFVAPDTSSAGLFHILSSIENTTIVAMLTNEELENSQIKPVRKFNCENIFYINLFSKSSL